MKFLFFHAKMNNIINLLVFIEANVALLLEYCQNDQTKYNSFDKFPEKGQIRGV
jgi:hypothetical protein